MSLAGIRVDDIVRATSYHYKRTPKELRSEDRHRSVSYPRMVSMFLARETGRSLPEIGERLGLDHTTVLHGVRNVAGRLRSEDALHADLATIRGILELRPRPFEIQAAECFGKAIAALGDWRRECRRLELEHRTSQRRARELAKVFMPRARP